jgi:hypothetical protein
MTQKRPDFDYRYSIIPGGAVTDPNISMRDLQVLALLGRHTDKKGWCWRSQVEMAKELRCGRATVGRSIKRLVDAGWLEAVPLPRGKTVLAQGEQPFSAFKYRVKIDRDDEEENEQAADVPNNGHPPEAPPNNGQGVPIAGGQEVPAQVGTHRRTSFKDPLNSLPPAAAGESEKVASLGEGAPERWPEFRSAVAKAWPDGFPADDEFACRKQFERLTRQHRADLLMACATLHGGQLRQRREKRGTRNGTAFAKRPSNWLCQGDWQGYIPQAEQAAIEEAKITTALGNVRRALGDGVFSLLRQQGMSDFAIARLDGMTFNEPAEFTVTSASQSVMLDKYFGALERHLKARPNFRLVQPVRRAS